MIRKIGIISRTYRHINRYSEIIAVLVKHGFGDFIASTHLDKYIDFGKRILPGEGVKPVSPLSRWERVRIVLEELGPTFIKFGQIMSNRPDLLPHDLIKEFEKLQDAVPSFSEEESISIVEHELGGAVASVFESFVSTPIASASISQVHKAVLKNGDEVVVKVQRPGISERIDVDLEIMLHLAGLAAKHVEGVNVLDPVAVLHEFERTIRKEIDFLIEAKYIERFARNFKNNPHIYVPKVYHEFSTKKVLVLEYIDAVKLSNVDGLNERGIDKKHIAELAIDLELEQIFEHGFFHADPHPGNIFALKNNVLCFLDFGMMGHVFSTHRAFLGDIMVGVVKRDARLIAKALVQFSKAEKSNVVEKLEFYVREILEEQVDVQIRDIHMGDLLNKIIDAVIECKITVPPNMYLLSKTLMIIEGVCRSLWPECNVVEHIEPYAVNLLKERLSPGRVAKEMVSSISDFALLIKDFPSEVKDILDQVKKGKIKMEFQHTGLEPMFLRHDQISNRIAFSIVLAALIIGSSLIVHSKIPPMFYGVPVIGIIGFVGAGLMGFWLLISMVRHGRM